MTTPRPCLTYPVLRESLSSGLLPQLWQPSRTQLGVNHIKMIHEVPLQIIPKFPFIPRDTYNHHASVSQAQITKSHLEKEGKKKDKNLLLILGFLSNANFVKLK